MSDGRLACAVFFFVLAVPASVMCIVRPLLVEQLVFGLFTEYVQEWSTVWVRWYGVLHLLAYCGLVCWLVFGAVPQ